MQERTSVKKQQSNMNQDKEERTTMETRFYQTQEISIVPIAEALVSEYQRRGMRHNNLVMSTRPPFNSRKPTP